jgi:hypothetical protein
LCSAEGRTRARAGLIGKGIIVVADIDVEIGGGRSTGWRASRRGAVQGPTMKYLCLIYGSEAHEAAMSKADTDTMMGEYFAFSEDLRRDGRMLAGEGLQPTSAATTVRVRNGKTSTTDGPFAETKEQLGGFYLIEAADLNEAVRIAARIPSVRYGCVEVRPVMDYGQP